MAFDANKLACVFNANGNSLFFYVTDDVIGTLEGGGYFSSVASNFKKGDLIICSMDNDTTPTATILSVTSADGAATVTVDANIDIAV